jgi:hypothetical protein
MRDYVSLSGVEDATQIDKRVLINGSFRKVIMSV